MRHLAPWRNLSCSSPRSADARHDARPSSAPPHSAMAPCPGAVPSTLPCRRPPSALCRARSAMAPCPRRPSRRPPGAVPSTFGRWLLLNDTSAVPSTRPSRRPPSALCRARALLGGGNGGRRRHVDGASHVPHAYRVVPRTAQHERAPVDGAARHGVHVA